MHHRLSAHHISVDRNRLTRSVFPQMRGPIDKRHKDGSQNCSHIICSAHMNQSAAVQIAAYLIYITQICLTGITVIVIIHCIQYTLHIIRTQRLLHLAAGRQPLASLPRVTVVDQNGTVSLKPFIKAKGTSIPEVIRNICHILFPIVGTITILLLRFRSFHRPAEGYNDKIRPILRFLLGNILPELFLLFLRQDFCIIKDTLRRRRRVGSGHSTLEGMPDSYCSGQAKQDPHHDKPDTKIVQILLFCFFF